VLDQSGSLAFDSFEQLGWILAGKADPEEVSLLLDYDRFVTVRSLVEVKRGSAHIPSPVDARETNSPAFIGPTTEVEIVSGCDPF